MKKTQVIELLNTIRGTLMSFVAITLFISLGVGFYLGIDWASDSINTMAGDQFRQGSVHHFEITFPFGLTDDDLEQLAHVEGVDEVEANYLAFQEMRVGDDKHVVRVGQLPQTIDTFVDVQGVLPSDSDEMAIETNFAKAYGTKLGDTIEFVRDATDEDDGDGMRYLARSTFKVTAIVKSPAFLHENPESYGTATVGSGRIDALAWITGDAFDAAAYLGGRPHVLVRSNSLSGLSVFDEETPTAALKLEKRIRELGDMLGDARVNALRSEKEELLRVGESAYEAGQAELAASEARIDEGQRSLDAAAREIEEKQRQLTQGQKELEDGRKELAEGQKSLEDNQKELEDGRGTLQDGAWQWMDGQMALISGTSSAYTQLADARRQLQAGQTEWNRAAEVLEAKRLELEEAEVQYNEVVEAVNTANGVLERYRKEVEDVVDRYGAGDVTREQFGELMRTYGDAAAELLGPYNIELPSDADAIYDNLQLYREKVLDGIERYRDQLLNSSIAVSWGASTLDDVAERVQSAHADLDAAQAQLDVAQNELESQREAYEEAQAQYEAQKADGEQELRDSEELLVEGQRQLVEGQQQIKDGQRRLEEGKRQVEDGQRRLDEGRSQLDEAQKGLDEGRREVDDGRRRLDEGYVQAEEAARQLEEGRESLTSITACKWLVLSLKQNGAVYTMLGYVHVAHNLKWSMASLFLIVGLLVCYSALSRMAYEQAGRIGIKKAIGFSDKEIYAPFVLYVALCVALGVVVGTVLAVFVVENTLLSALGKNFVVGSTPFVHIADIVRIALVELVLILCSTLLAVSGMVGQEAVELLAGGRAHAARRHFFESWRIWKRMSLLQQTIVNNTINDRRRVFGTLVGVAGCTALVVCAATLHDNVMRSYSYQYDEISHYQTVVMMDSGSDAAAKGASALEDAGMPATKVFGQTFLLLQPDGTQAKVGVVVPLENERFADFMTLMPSDHTDKDTGKGIWMSRAYGDYYDMEPGDNVVVSDTAGTQYSLPVTGFFDYHLLRHVIVMDKDTYRAIFGKACAANQLYVQARGGDAKAIEDVVEGLDGYVATVDDYATSRRGLAEFSNVTRVVVVVYLVLSTVMAICILLNIDNMYVEEKKRELVVLMINGYSLRESKRYIWCDTLALTGFGILVGHVLGGVIGALAVRSIERSYSVFLHDVSWFAIGFATFSTVALASVSLLFALRKMNGFDLSSIDRL